MTETLKRIELHKLKDLINRLPPGKAAMYMEACVWCLSKNDHQNGVEFELQYRNKNYSYPVYWIDEAIDFQEINSFYNLDDTVSFGAEAIAMFFCITHTEFNDLERSTKKTGIDYWLSHEKSNPNLPFQNSGRLEVSGILKETETNTVAKRIKEKIKQSEQSDKTTLPVYIVVVAFDRPYAKMVLKNANS